MIKNDLWKEGHDGYKERAQNDQRNLHDLVRWLEYHKTGFPASRCSTEQEQYWADQLKKLLGNKQ